MTVLVAYVPTPEGDAAYAAAVEEAGRRRERLVLLNTPREGGLSCTGEMMQGMGSLAGNSADLELMTANADEFDRAYVEEVTSGRAVTQPNIWQVAEADRILRGYIDQAQGCSSRTAWISASACVKASSAVMVPAQAWSM